MCDVNYLSKSAITKKYPEILELLKRTQPVNDIESETLTQNKNNVTTSKKSMKEGTSSKIPPAFPNTTVMQIFEDGIAKVEEMFIECRWVETVLSCNDYLSKTFSESGFCYTFPSETASDSNFTLIHPGPEFGFTATIAIRQEDYLLSNNHGAGMKIVVHERGSVAFTSVKGLNIAPGFEYNIGVGKEIHKRLQPPYAQVNCIDSDDYSYESCLEKCHNNIRYNKCGCNFTSKGPDGCTMAVIGNSNQCGSITPAEYQQCKRCEPSCQEITYQMTISSLAYPSVVGYDILQSKFNFNQTIEEVRSLLLQVKVYFNRMEYDLIEQHPSMGIHQLLADIGGQLGFFLGASCISIIEILEVLVQCLVTNMRVKFKNILK